MTDKGPRPMPATASHHQDASASMYVAALLTPSGRGAVATIVAQGPQIAELVERYFQAAAGKPLREFPLQRIVFGTWHVDDQHEDLVVCRTKPDQLEIHCHGGTTAARRILNCLAELKVCEIPWQAWLRRVSPTSLNAAIEIALAEARTTKAAAILLDQQRGAFTTAIQSILSQLARAAGEQAVLEIDQLLTHATLGLHLLVPWKVVLAGRPNAGKSSLINAMVGYDRSIVYDQPGTTRDVVTATAVLDGWLVEFADTAGIRNSADDPIEQAGVLLAQAQMRLADLVVLVHDLQTVWDDTEENILREFPSCLVVHNKADLAPSFSCPPQHFLASAVSSPGIGPLTAAIARQLVPNPPDAGAAVPFTAEISVQLAAASQAIASGELTMAGEILSALIA